MSNDKRITRSSNRVPPPPPPRSRKPAEPEISEPSSKLIWICVLAIGGPLVLLMVALTVALAYTKSQPTTTTLGGPVAIVTTSDEPRVIEDRADKRPEPEVVPVLPVLPVKADEPMKDPVKEPPVVPPVKPPVKLAPLRVVPIGDVTLTAGERKKIDVRIQRGTRKGPLVVQIEEVPGKVTADKVTINDDEETARLEITTVADAASGRLAVRVHAAMPGLENAEDRASFSLSIQPGKKEVADKAKERTKAREAGVAAGLLFLALHQSADGHWGLHDFPKHARTAPLPGGNITPDGCQPQTTMNNDTAGTAFGLLPFLAAGVTHKASKEPKYAEYTKGVARGLDWLLRKQSKLPADRGTFGGGMYSHALATIVMCEAYGATKDVRLKASAQAAIDYLVLAQDDKGGGWRYTPKVAGDSSVTSWVATALQSAKLAKLNVPRATFKRMEAFLDSCEVRKGEYCYTPGGAIETLTMTACCGLGRVYLGVNQANASMVGTAKYLKARPPWVITNIYYVHRATMVMHQLGGDDWKHWELGPDGTGTQGLHSALLKRQDDGTSRRAQLGSFAGDSHVGGRLGATSLSLLALQISESQLMIDRRVADAK